MDSSKIARQQDYVCLASLLVFMLVFLTQSMSINPIRPSTVDNYMQTAKVCSITRGDTHTGHNGQASASGRIKYSIARLYNIRRTNRFAIHQCRPTLDIMQLLSTLDILWWL